MAAVILVFWMSIAPPATRIAHPPFHRIGFGISIAAHKLNGGAGNLAAYFIGKAFCHRTVDDARQAVLGVNGGAMNEQARGLHAHLHFCQLYLNTLKIDQRLAELFAFLNIRHHIVQRARSLP